MVVEAPDGSEETLAALAVDCDAIMTCFAQVTPAVVRAAERCRCISRYGVGVDNIAVDVATDLGIPVTYVPDYCVDEVSDHVMAMLLTWNRQVGFYDGVAKAGRWEGTPSPHPLTRLRGQDHRHPGFRTHRPGGGRQGAGVRAIRVGVRSLPGVGCGPAQTE